MFLCANCGQTFDSPKDVADFTSEYWGERVTHYTPACPYCGSDDFDRMRKCVVCGEDISPDERLCDNCRELIRDVADSIKSNARYLSLRYNLDYTEFIENLMEEL